MQRLSIYVIFNKDIMIGIGSDKITRELFKQLLTNYQEPIVSQIKASDFVFDHVDGFSYLCHQIVSNPGVLYKDSPQPKEKKNEHKPYKLIMNVLNTLPSH